jgi:hypothetical protein
MKVLFLDMDGVCNSKQHFLATKDFKTPGADTLSDADLFAMKRDTNANNMWVLGYILEKVPDLKIVISSAWRNHYDVESFKELFKIYKLDGSRIIGKTPRKLSSERYSEIRMWLEEYEELHHKKVDFLAVDDYVIWDVMHEFKDREILTDGWVGLTMHDAFKIIKHFNSEFKEPEILI